jgi:hypothetical protein
MKKIIFILSIVISVISVNAQIKVKSDGKVGIRTTNPSNDVEIYGSATKFSFSQEGSYQATPIYLCRYYADPRFYPYESHKGQLGLASNFWQYAYVDRIYYTYSCTQYSDQKFKKNITKMKKCLDKVLLLNGVKYDLDFTSIGSQKEIDEKYGKNQFGLIAQDVLEVVPEVVTNDSNGYAVDYIKLIPLLIEAIKEQNAKIVALETESAKSKLKSAEVFSENEQSTATLSQNVPNPFNENTKIGYYLPTTIQSAVLYIYDLQGKQIKSILITDRETCSVTIQALELQAGMYYYSLIADGNIIGTEKMILTK